MKDRDWHDDVRTFALVAAGAALIAAAVFLRDVRDELHKIRFDALARDQGAELSKEAPGVLPPAKKGG